MMLQILFEVLICINQQLKKKHLKHILLNIIDWNTYF